MTSCACLAWSCASLARCGGYRFGIIPSTLYFAAPAGILAVADALSLLFGMPVGVDVRRHTHKRASCTRMPTHLHGLTLCAHTRTHAGPYKCARARTHTQSRLLCALFVRGSRPGRCWATRTFRTSSSSSTCPPLLRTHTHAHTRAQRARTHLPHTRARAHTYTPHIRALACTGTTHACTPNAHAHTVARRYKTHARAPHTNIIFQGSDSPAAHFRSHLYWYHNHGYPLFSEYADGACRRPHPYEAPAAL
jgi:hypothetical protein